MLSDLERNLEGIIQKFRADLTTVRTGRATASLVEDLKVEAYPAGENPSGLESSTRRVGELAGRPILMTLKELASITVPEPRQILIVPWDKAVLEAIETALRSAGFNPAVEGESLRVVLPPLAGEEREKLLREVGEKMEGTKVAARLARREAVERTEKSEDNKEISEDEAFSQKKKIDELLEEYNDKIEEISQEKKSQLKMD